MRAFGGQMPRIGFRLRAVPGAFKNHALPGFESAGGMGRFSLASESRQNSLR